LTLILEKACVSKGLCLFRSITRMQLCCAGCHNVKKAYRMHRDEALRCFVCCPFCGSERLDYVPQDPAGHFHLAFGRQTLTCEECGAQWLLCFKAGFTWDYLEWAKLEIASKNGKGLELIGKEISKDEWQKMAIEMRRTFSLSKSPANQVAATQPQAQPLPPPPPPPPQAVQTCPTCSRPLTFVQQYNRWYCYNCKKYP
jgi:hypothetical protein